MLSFSHGCLSAHGRSCLQTCKSQSFIVLRRQWVQCDTDRSIHYYPYPLCATVHHAQAQALTCSRLNMDLQHASQQPSPPPPLLLLYSPSSDGYCLPLTNCQCSIPLLQMSIDQSARKAVGMIWSLTHTLILVSPLMHEHYRQKGDSIQLNGYQQTIL